MQKTIYVCDHCQKEFDARVWPSVNIGYRTKEDAHVEGADEHRFDVCPDCREELFRFFGYNIPVHRKRGGRQEPVDKGKIMALYKAGRSMPEIASDLGVTTSTIYKYVKQMKEAAPDE